MNKTSLFLLAPSSRFKGLMNLSLLLLCIFQFFTAKSTDSSLGFTVYYPKYAKTGEEVSFSFATHRNIHKIRVFVNGNSLGSTIVTRNRAKFKFKFVYASTKKLRFVGFSPNNYTVGELQGEITIAGKNQVPPSPTFDQTNVDLSTNISNTSEKQVSSVQVGSSTAISSGNVVYPNPNIPLAFSNTFDENEKTNAISSGSPAVSNEPPSNEIAWNFFSAIQSEVLPLARKYRLPASVIMAMAALESGYGYSQMALAANNYFGIKQWKPSVDAYQLKGQPDEHNGKVKVIGANGAGQNVYDESRRKDNWYRSFKSRAECIQFLVEEVFLHKTGKWRRDYSGAVREYHNKLDNGWTKQDAAYHFAYMLAAKGYNHLGGKYYANRTFKIIEKYNLLSYD